MRGTAVSVRRATAHVIATALMFGVASGGAGPIQGAEPEPPNIVVFYLDDVPPHDESLWNDPSRTPNFYEHFIANGVRFDQAISEYPLCCPARGNLLTGLHSHNNGVIENDALLFDPSEHIGKAMQDAGYASMFIGKYLNQANDLTPEQWVDHAAGWTQLDAIKLVNGAFYSYPLFTKQGTLTVKGLHSTQMVANRTVMHLRETPADQPVFAVLSIYNMHAPNRPMAQDVGSPACANKAPYNPPNYNEADVTDKPAYIQEKPLLPDTNGWPMVTYCEEMLGVDRAIGQVTAELEAQGRLDNTLLIFTADNGSGWGAHRLGQQKIWPYTTPVPLYMSWPAAGWGNTPSTITEVVSNIDLAPTFCELARSCALGPFAHEKAGPDGTSLVSLINGTANDLGRDAVLEQAFRADGWSWTGLRTTSVYDADERWHYIEYANGFRELYDLVNDPYELENVASDNGYADTVASLQARLADLRVAGLGAGTGTITIAQDARPNSGNDYSFSGDLGSFVLDDDTDPANPSSRTFTDLPTGTYTVTRPGSFPSWVRAGINCNGVAVRDGSLGSAKIYLHTGEHVTCTWVDVTRRPDAMIALTTSGPYRADNVYRTLPVKAQTVRRDGVALGKSYTYRLRIQNDSATHDSFFVRGVANGPSTFRVSYTQSGADVTAGVVAGTHDVTYLAPGGYREIVVRVTVGPGTPAGAVLSVVLTARSASDPNVIDVVRAVAAR